MNKLFIIFDFTRLFMSIFETFQCFESFTILKTDIISSDIRLDTHLRMDPIGDSKHRET